MWEASILQADLVGFGALCRRLASQGPRGLGRLSAILNQVFEQVLTEAIAPYEGYVVHFGGDSVTAVFRGPNDAWRAAALTAERVMLQLEMGVAR